MLNLDTHILIHALEGTLKPSELQLLASSPWSVSAIVLWELAKLVQLKRVVVDLDSPYFRRVVARVHIWPLDLATCRQSAQLDFQSDPADEIIAATSIVRKIPLLTRDRVIRRSKLVPLA
jgi:PIN domain nuclease of toxin-antitoxin system